MWTAGSKPIKQSCNQPEREYDPARWKSQGSSCCAGSV